ncbi:MAG TPA: pirin family protein [Thermodesulfobacteriota bacterium]|nr:pirin family protein [Thermodesulfobacteriota bacterium]
MIVVRLPEDIHQAEGPIEGGTFRGRWHFSFGDYSDPGFRRFGALRVFNDDTISPGAVWPLHPHRDIEVVTYCAGGEFLHADEHGEGGVLKKGDVQHTTVGRGMWHSEINNRRDAPMRFIQMWFYPSVEGLTPTVEQKAVKKAERTNRLLPLVSPVHAEALFIHSDARIYSSFLEEGKLVKHAIEAQRGVYLYVVEGGPVRVDGERVPVLGAVKVEGEEGIAIKAGGDSELLVVDVVMVGGV